MHLTFTLPLAAVLIIISTNIAGATEAHVTGKNVSSTTGSPTASRARGKTRMISFPKQGLGYYSVRRAPVFMEAWPESVGKGDPAKGMVWIPEKVEIALATGWGDGASLPLLLKLKPGDIQGLNLEGSLVTDESFKFICHLTELKELDLAGSNTDDRDLELVANAIPHLQSLNISYTRVTDRCIDSILKMKQLNTLVLWKDKINDAALKKLSKSKALKFLDIRETPISDRGLKDLCQLNSLSSLNLASTTITDDGLASLNKLRQLKMLDLSSTRITDAGLDKLRTIPSLECLNLSHTEISDRGLRKLADLKSLRKLWLRDLSGVTDSSIQVLASHSKLENLEIQKTLISPQGVLSLAKLLPGSEVHSKSSCKCRKRTRVN
ncbi:hypothetical protein BH10CYA1_BH10CYA1_28100 [soil metagenome]